MNCFKNENVVWQNRLHLIRDDLALLATEDADLVERHLICREVLHRIEGRQKQIEECRQQLRADIIAIEQELGLTNSISEK